MSRIPGKVFAVIFFLAAMLFAATCHAAADYATFESFYKPGWQPMWWLAALTTLVAAGAVILTGGAASPIVTSIGTWIGGMMGFSGIAATNAGLALMGGGSIASGGFGIVGGAALLTAALTFSTEIAIDYGADRVLNAYSYSKFSEQSKEMTTLPLPKNKTGPDSYKAALKILGQANEKEPTIDYSNQKLIAQAAEALTSDRLAVPSDTTDQLREQSLLALLRFLQNDYSGAKATSSNAYGLAQRLNQKATLPAFIYSTAILYDDKPDVDKALRFFAYSVTNEDTPLSPLLFAIILDRAMYRMNDGAVNAGILEQLYNLSKSFKHDKRKAVVQQGILNRYFIRLKLEQQKIRSLSRSESHAIRSNKVTLDDVKQSLENYMTLLGASNSILESQRTAVMGRISEEWLSRRWQEQWLEELERRKDLWAAYSAEVPALESLVRELESYQQSLGKPKASNEVSSPTHIWLIVLVALFLGRLGYRWIVLSRA